MHGIVYLYTQYKRKSICQTVLCNKARTLAPIALQYTLAQMHILSRVLGLIYFTFQKGLEVSRTRNTEKTWTIIFASGVIVYYIWQSAYNVLHNWFFIAEIVYSHRLDNEGPFHIRISFFIFSNNFFRALEACFLTQSYFFGADCYILHATCFYEIFRDYNNNTIEWYEILFFIRFFITRMNLLRHLNPI